MRRLSALPRWVGVGCLAVAAALSCGDDDPASDGCAPGQTRCLADLSASEVCDSSGRYVLEETCEDGSCLDGSCVGSDCTVGDFRCQENMLEVCTDGRVYDLVRGCPPGSVCDPDEGGCIVGPGSVEVCDGFDNDVDGMTDEEDDGPICPVGSMCREGACTDLEICDGVDNDEDGVTDEGDELCPLDLQCVEGICRGQEICDGIDNDEDGETDEQAVCPGIGRCLFGACT